MADEAIALRMARHTTLQRLPRSLAVPELEQRLATVEPRVGSASRAQSP